MGFVSRIPEECNTVHYRWRRQSNVTEYSPPTPSVKVANINAVLAFMHQSIESPGGGAGKWPGDTGLILFSTPKCCPAGWGHN